MAEFFISILLTIATAIMSLLAPINTLTAPTDDSDFVPVLRFAVMSDTHVKALGDTNSRRIQKAVSLAYSDAQQDEQYKNLDAIMFVGDLTNGGTKAQFHAFKSTVNSVVKEDTTVIALMGKGHDYKKLNEDVGEYYESLTDFTADTHIVINGYHFITVSSMHDGLYTTQQLTWMKAQLDEAVADTPDKPIFVAHHEHISDTVYGSADGEWGVDNFKEIFANYPQIVHFSGHSHYPLNDPRSIWQDEYTAIGTGAIYYMEFTVDGVSCIHPDNYKKTGQLWIVEVDKDSNVRLRGFDTYSNTLLCEYILDNPANPLNREYNADKLLASSSAPVFAENAELKVSGLGSTKTVTVPKAESTDGKILFLYRVTVYDASGNVKDSQYVINNYWTSPVYNSVKIKVNADSGDRIVAVAENAYGMASEPLIITL